MSKITKETREQELSRAIDMIGIIAVNERIKTEEDRRILDKLLEKRRKLLEGARDKRLKDAGISF